jgi:hypothetical protein
MKSRRTAIRERVEMAMNKRNKTDEYHQLMMHADVLEEVNARYEAIQKEMDAYVAETERTPTGERTDAWKKEKEKRLEEYYERMDAVTDRWNALDAAVEQLWTPGVATSSRN